VFCVLRFALGHLYLMAFRIYLMAFRSLLGFGGPIGMWVNSETIRGAAATVVLQSFPNPSVANGDSFYSFRFKLENPDICSQYMRPSILLSPLLQIHRDQVQEVVSWW